MARAIYVLCALMSSVCAFLLLRRHRTSRTPLVLWGGLCFVGLALNNVLLVVDRLILPDVDLTVARMAPAVVGIAALVYGLVAETE